ncbi:MAG: DUF1269 domain-containing protein [Thermoleophilia bacterium]|jgi:uncharacterized membrane protein|nr:DUF1269 domain-containing protein [Thermoleophilia bacterium]
MGKEQDTFVYVGVYTSEDAAKADYEVVKELHAAGVIGSYDAGVIHKEADGKVHVNKDETATRKGAWAGAGIGAVVGILFPPSIIGTAAVAGLGGGLIGHFWKGMSRGDLKDIGEMLDTGDAALIVIGDWRLEEAIDKAFARAEKTIEREIRGLDRALVEQEISSLMSGQGGPA